MLHTHEVTGSSPAVSTTSPQAAYRLRRLFMPCIKKRLAFIPLILLQNHSPCGRSGSCRQLRSCAAGTVIFELRSLKFKGFLVRIFSCLTGCVSDEKTRRHGVRLFGFVKTFCGPANNDLQGKKEKCREDIDQLPALMIYSNQFNNAVSALGIG